MADSSHKGATGLKDVRPRNAFSLLSIVRAARYRDVSFVAAKYAEASSQFPETVAFLEGMGWLRTRDGVVHVASDMVERLLMAEGIRRILVLSEALLSTPNPYRTACAEYLLKFRLSDDGFIHRPSVEQRLSDAGVRDFFMDLGVVTHRRAGDYFVLNKPFAACIQWARSTLGMSSAQLERRAKERTELGYRAERAVVAWEIQRVGRALADSVHHISNENPAASFDIQSVTVSGDGVALPRFIEVKAVSSTSLEFHWSSAEIEAAQTLRDAYFLYLLPVSGQELQMSQLEIIKDPFSAIYHNDSSWSTSVADTICRRRDHLVS